MTAILVLVLAGAAIRLLLHRKPAFTEKDTVVRADFSNTTDDPVFGGTLLGSGVKPGQGGQTGRCSAYTRSSSKAGVG